jgi:ubiquinone/menaquinone biosynthesis C-methylase UbiE
LSCLEAISFVVVIASGRTSWLRSVRPLPAVGGICERSSLRGICPAGRPRLGSVGGAELVLDDVEVQADAERWNHNIHYHSVLLAALPDRADRALDVGCGEGMLTRRLRDLIPHVSGIDLDRASITLARAQDPAHQIDYILGDFLTHAFQPESFDAITCVAALHHMDQAAALARMRHLLRPGGTLAVLGCAHSRLPADLPWELAAVIAHQAHRLTKTHWQHPAPTVWPPAHNHHQIRQLASQVLPTARYRRHLLWRYTLT